MAQMKEVDPDLKGHLEGFVAGFHEGMAAKGVNFRLTGLTTDDDPDMNCPCGIEFIIDPVTGNIIGKRCKRCVADDI